MEWVGGLERLLEVFWACTLPSGVRSGGAVDHGHHLHPTTLSVLVPPITASLRQGRVIAALALAEVTSSLGFDVEVVLDHLLTVGVLSGDI